MRNSAAKTMALGGVLGTLAVVIMCMGTLIPVATFVCPMLCMMILKLVLTVCGSRIGWAWYGAVAILSLLLAPDKEAAAVFAFLGHYPILKPKLDQLPFAPLWKLLLFNGAILAMYWLLGNLFGMTELSDEFREMGAVMTVILLILGNVTFVLLDILLGRRLVRKKHGR